ncbi:signal transduction histidine kinase [Paenibacillus taihuensis]|uniref:histidine kinase n=1 Tax=Paenibacillus taihuensis TaxID=1156355 RepID=A0A3D9S7Q3_9BACL|nr:HAMP domain-containing sensor histidine kinase [Paenibacillus taihuensis]REE89064.1 signal transduction histidine kinase [Paenibacillus taihuensis]
MNHSYESEHDGSFKYNHIPEEFWQLFEISPGGVSIGTDPHCTTIIHNRKASRMLRIPAGGFFSHSSFKPPSVKVFRDGIELLPHEMPMQRSGVDGEEVQDEVLEFVWPDGFRTVSVWNSIPILNKEDRVVGVLATTEEITRYVLREREMQLDKINLENVVTEKIEEQTRLRSEVERLDRFSLVAQMAASISHEVRNPISTVRGFLQLMQRNQTYNDNYYKLIISELDRANEIIGNFLSLSKQNDSAERLEKDLAETLGFILPLLEADALMMGKKVSFIEKSVTPVRLNSKEIQQVLINLVRNSLEASEKGTTVVVEMFENEASIGFYVKDEGPGIPPEIVAQLGTPFLTTKEKGTGLGLSICYDIARRHGAEISIDSGEKGTTFKFAFAKQKSQSA